MISIAYQPESETAMISYFCTIYCDVGVKAHAIYSGQAACVVFYCDDEFYPSVQDYQADESSGDGGYIYLGIRAMVVLAFVGGSDGGIFSTNAKCCA